MAGEFALIDRFFGLRSGQSASVQVPLGIGDDCAAVRVSPGHLLLTSVDTFSEGVHFFPGTDPVAVGHKALAVNLSDLAACGARPLGCLLAISLPANTPDNWLAGFASGFRDLADSSACPLIGGDTTRSSPGGGVSVSVTVLGEVPDEHSILKRSGAKAGDDIWVSGRLGAAAVAVRSRMAPDGKVTGLGDPQRLSAGQRLDWPQPRLLLGLALRGIASACIDVSDGLVADLGHVLTASGGLGATLQQADLPMADELLGVDPAIARECVLYGGDDYELCFTVSGALRDTVSDLARALGLCLFKIGQVDAGSGIRLQAAGNHDGSAQLLESRGYEHF